MEYMEWQYCCGTDIVYDFPEDNHFDDPFYYDDIAFMIDCMEHKPLSIPCFALLSSDQKKAKEFMEFCGWCQITEWINPNTGNTIYMLTDKPELSIK